MGTHGHNGLLRFSGGADEGSIGHEGAINLKQKLSLIDDTDLWSPKVISTMNDYQLKVVKVQGDFTWHDHKDTDEVFIVIEGSLVIDIQGQDPVTLNEGEMYVVPKGVVHKPYRETCARFCWWSPAVLSTPARWKTVGDGHGTIPVANVMIVYYVVIR